MSHPSVIEAIPLPPSTNRPDPALLRNYLIEEVAYVLDRDANPQVFDALDSTTGALPRVIGFNGAWFWIDPDDTTTAHDGATCIVTADGYRYKINGVDFLVRSVLDKDLTAPPGSPTLGDAYIVPTGATGAWAGHGDDIALYTARGWVFIEPKVGQLVYVRDETGYYHYSTGGVWTAGVGANAFTAASVKASHLLGGRTHWVVVNQTTNAPPTLSGSGNAYIVGASPTGAWVGQTGKIAVDELSAWRIYAPVEGWTAYDQVLDADYIYSGSAWVSARGALKFFDPGTFTADTSSQTTGGSGNYANSDTVAPTTSPAYREDSVTITRIARSGANLRLSWIGQVAGGNAMTMALFRDAEGSALRWYNFPSAPNGTKVDLQFNITALDGNTHTYKIRGISNGSGAPGAFSRRRLTLEEFF